MSDAAVSLAALRPVEAQSLPEQVADRLVEAIAWGRLRPGERLPEAEIAQQLGVSRIPLREAIRTLEAQGIVVSEPHRGTRVAAFGVGWAERVRRARIALERLAFRDVALAQPVHADLRVEVDALISSMAQAAEAGDLLALIRADVAFHRCVVTAAGDPIIASLWDGLARHTLIVFGRETRTLMPVLRHAEEHALLRDRLLGGDLDELDAEVERHILRVPQLMERWSALYTTTGRKR